MERGELERTLEEMLSRHMADEAITLVETYYGEGGEDSDRIRYLAGNAWRKKGNWQKAMDNYLEAVAMNPASPAAGALEIAGDILAFYNKDMYNQ